jgi:Flp pilus assembly protein TadG
MARRVNVINQQTGAVLVEATLTMLVFLMVIFGIAEGGRLLQVQNTLINAAREGARFGVAPSSQLTANPGQLPSDSDVIARVNGFIGSNVISSSPVTVVPTWDATSTFRTVTITCQYAPMTGLFPFLQVNLVGRSTMKNETSW